MQIIILGSTGRTGSLVLLEALKRGHGVTALVRTPPSLETFTSTLPADQKANLTVISGSPLNNSDVSTAVNTAATKAGNTPLVVISALNSRRTSDSPWAPPHPTDSPPRMMTDSITNVISALKPHAATAKPKVIHVSAVGVGASVANTPWLFRTVVNWSNVRLTYDDHENVEAELKDAADLVGWVVVRPARLTEGNDDSLPNLWPAEKGSIGMTGKSNRGAVAKFCLDAAERSEWDGKDPIILS